MVRTIKNQSGFTLVELLVVVAIIGILASAGIPQYRRMVSKSKQSQAKVMLGQIGDAERAFFSEFGGYGNNIKAMGVQSDASTVAAPNPAVYYYAGFGVVAGGAPAGALAPVFPPVAADSVANAVNNSNSSYANVDVSATASNSFSIGRFTRVAGALASVNGTTGTLPIICTPTLAGSICGNVAGLTTLSANYGNFLAVASGSIAPGADPDAGTMPGTPILNNDVWTINETAAIRNVIDGKF